MARAYAARLTPNTGSSQVKVSVQLNTGTHHTLSLLGSTSEDEFKETWKESYFTRLQHVELDAPVGGIICQRTTSPASAEILRRYGVVLADGTLDWGSDADWVVDFGPVGDAARRGLRSPTASFNSKRGRVFAPSGDEVMGGAVEGTPTTSTD